MIRFRIRGISFSLPLLTVIMPLLAMRFGMRESMSTVLVSLGIHETAHLIAAKLMRVEISEIRIMPFGGSASIENPYDLSPLRLIVTAAAGPFANLLMIVLPAAFAYGGIVSAKAAACLFRTNITMLLFNLLPVLPMDGGRIAFALLRTRIKEGIALQAELWAGRILCLLLIGAAVSGWLRYGKFNITLVLAAIFIFSSEKDEKNALIRSKAERFSRVYNNSNVILPVKVYQMDASASIRDAMELIRPRETELFILLRGGVSCGFTDSRSLVDFILHDGSPNASLDSLPQLYRQSAAVQLFRTSSM